MRAADATTLFRTFLILVVAYLVLIRFNAAVTICIFAIAIILDAFDGAFAVWQVSKGKVGVIDYIMALVSSDKRKKDEIARYKHQVALQAKFGPRMDIAGDRVAEYVMWILFTYVGIVPLILLFLVVIRHSFADALMGARGTSSKMKSWFANTFYTSNWSRAAINVLKVVTFSYLILVYVSHYPLLIGYALVALLFAFVMLRGAAEIYESVKYG